MYNIAKVLLERYWQMKRETDLDEVKKNTMMLFDAVPIIPLEIGIVQHPFIENIYMGIVNNHDKIEIIDITQNENQIKYRSFLFQNIMNAPDVARVYMYVRSPWKLTWLMFVKDYMNEKDFAEYLADSWMSEENPNADVNVPIETSIKWFKEANKQYLMNAKEFQTWNSFSDSFYIYRGVSVGRVPLGLSWTRDKEKAEWFQHRFDNNDDTGFLQKVLINKENVLAYFNSRGEEEVVIDVLAINKRFN